MTIKSLTVTEKAYDALKRQKRGNESFSEVILRISNEQRNAKQFFGILNAEPEEISEWKESMLKRRKIVTKEELKRKRRFQEKWQS